MWGQGTTPTRNSLYGNYMTLTRDRLDFLKMKKQKKQDPVDDGYGQNETAQARWKRLVVTGKVSHTPSGLGRDDFIQKDDGRWVHKKMSQRGTKRMRDAAQDRTPTAQASLVIGLLQL